jgi:hypothetical protein
MPASTPSKAPHDAGTVRAVVARLARPDGDGGVVIERAAIMAEGRMAGEVETWIVENGGRPEATTSAPTGGGGLHGARTEGIKQALNAGHPRRYVLPSSALEQSHA